MTRLLLISAASLLALSLGTTAFAQGGGKLTTSGTQVNPPTERSAAPATPAPTPPPSRTPQNSERFTGVYSSSCPPAGTVASSSAGTGPGPHCPPYEGSSSRGGNGTGVPSSRNHPADTER